MDAGPVRGVDGAAADGAGGGVEAGGGVAALEHVPVGLHDLAEEERVVHHVGHVHLAGGGIRGSWTCGQGVSCRSCSQFVSCRSCSQFVSYRRNSQFVSCRSCSQFVSCRSCSRFVFYATLATCTCPPSGLSLLQWRDMAEGGLDRC